MTSRCLHLGPPAALGLYTLGPPRGPSTTCYPRGGLSLTETGAAWMQSLLALASQICLQPLLALCFFDLDVSSGLDSLERFDIFFDLDVSSGLNGLNGLHGLFA